MRTKTLRGIGIPLDAHQLIQRRDLLLELVGRDIKLRYKRSWVGMAWSLLNPLLQFVVFSFVFQSILPLDIPNYPVFLFSGILVWNWFSSSLVEATASIVGNRELIRRPGFPAAILPVVAVTSNLVHFLLALPILLIIVLLNGTSLTAALLALPLVIAVQFGFTVGLGYLLSTVYVTFRDTQYLLGVALLLGFYLTPVFYDSSGLALGQQAIYRLNPMANLLEAYRAILLKGTFPDGRSLTVIAALCLGLVIIGYKAFRHTSYQFVEEL
jgi:lipopolysaccharide transport system permease protein